MNQAVDMEKEFANITPKTTIVMVTQKNGRVCPITKLTIDCEQCGNNMFIVRKNSKKRIPRTHWLCATCKHKHHDESNREALIRKGII